MGFGKGLTIVIFALIMLGSAYAAPGIPHQFYGFVTVNGAAADGANIVAKIGEIEVASTTTINGNYGFDPSIFYVTDPNSTNTGKEIDFFLNGTSVDSYTFIRGELTELNLAIGTAPVCGDTKCSGGETCTSCTSDCGECGTTTGGGGPSGGGGGGGGGGSPKLTVKIEGECLDREIEVTVLNTVGNPSPNAMVRVVRDRKTITEKTTGEDGLLSFSFSEEGDYSFYTTKSGYAQNTKTITVSRCPEGSTGTTVTTEGIGNLCANTNCDDGNPCTRESCVASTGHCSYENQAEGTICSIEGTCLAGVCTEPEKEVETGPSNPTGFFGFGSGQTAGLLIVIIGAIAAIAYLAMAGTRKGKK